MDLKKFINTLGDYINKKKDIKRIKVKAGTKAFWVKDKEKIDYYLNLSKKLTSNIISQNANIAPSIIIKKVVYE